MSEEASLAPALDGLLVVELSESVRGRYAGRLLAETGATVVRVERPQRGNDLDRPWLDAGKQSVLIDLEQSDGLGLLSGLIRRADVFLEDLGPTRLRSAGLPLEELAAAQPELIVTSVTDFGNDGPWVDRPSSDLIVSALSGICAINGYAGEPPLREPGPQSEMVGALAGFIGTLAALIERDRGGRGQTVDASALEAMVNVLSPYVLQHSYQGSGPKPREASAGYLFPCADGWMSLIISADKAWETIVSVFGIQLDADDDRFSSEGARRKNSAALRDVLAPILMTKTRAEIFHELSPMRVVCGMVLSPAELLEDSHLAARDAFVRVGGEGRAGCRVPRAAIRTHGEPLPQALRVPAAGEDSHTWLPSGQGDA